MIKCCKLIGFYPPEHLINLMTETFCAKLRDAVVL